MNETVCGKALQKHVHGGEAAGGPGEEEGWAAGMMDELSPCYGQGTLKFAQYL